MLQASIARRGWSCWRLGWRADDVSRGNARSGREASWDEYTRLFLEAGEARGCLPSFPGPGCFPRPFPPGVVRSGSLVAKSRTVASPPDWFYPGTFSNDGRTVGKFSACSSRGSEPLVRLRRLTPIARSGSEVQERDPSVGVKKGRQVPRFSTHARSSHASNSTVATGSRSSEYTEVGGGSTND